MYMFTIQKLIRIAGLILIFEETTSVRGMPQYEVQVGQNVDFVFSENTTGTCCSHTEQSPCSTPCEIRIVLCFLEADYPFTGFNSEISCPLGSVIFAFDAGNNTVTLNATVEATSTTYPGRYEMAFKVQSNGTEIGVGHMVYMHQIRTLSIPHIRVVCIEGYFGPDCGCSPRNDSTGHFTCAADGTTVCLPGYQNPETNCTEEDVVTQEPTTMETTTIATDLETASSEDVTSGTLLPYTITSNIDTTSATAETTTPTDSIIATTVTTSATNLILVPVAAGGSVGGLVLIVVIVVLITAVRIARKAKSKRNGKGEEEFELNMTNLSSHDDVGNLYASVNKEAKTVKEVAPPIIPYQGDIYEENAGLYANCSNTVAESHCATTCPYANVSMPQHFPVYNIEPEYCDIVTHSQAQLTEPTSESFYTNVSSRAFAEPEYSELASVQQLQANSTEGSRGIEDPKVESEQPGYGDIAEAKETPQVVYADVSVSPTPKDGALTTKEDNTHHDVNTTGTEVQYARILNNLL